MSKTVAIIPARGGSKRLPGKNIMPLGGLPLIVHSIKYALQNPDIIDSVYVSTDDHTIKEIALSHGAKVIDRPLELSGDDQTTVSALAHALPFLGEVENVILLQPTNPLRPQQLLYDAWRIFEDGAFDSLFTVSRDHHKFGRIESGRFIPSNYVPGQRSQDLEPLFYENGLLYISKAELIKNHAIIGENHHPMITDHIFSGVDIDTAEDFEYASYLLNKYQ